MIRLVLFVLALTLAACSDPAPIAPHPAGKATCVLCEFLDDDNYTIADGQGAHESPAADDSTQTDSTDADSTASDLVVFEDAKLKRAVRKVLGINNAAILLTKQEVASLTRLEADDLAIESVAGLEHFTGLTWLSLRENQIVDVSPLAGLTNLQRLYLWGNQITDISPLAGLTNLQTLSLWATRLWM